METTPTNEVKTGLEILYAKPGSTGNVATRDLTKEARERYWIRPAAELGIAAETFEVTLPRMIERAESGRNRNEPGDGFPYVFRSGTKGTGGRAEWFEVTEVFEGAEAKDIETFMRLANGGQRYPGFDPVKLARGLNFGMPSRAAAAPCRRQGDRSNRREIG